MAQTVHQVEYFRIWDLPTRIFHWLLVAAVGFLLFTGLLAPENWLDLHRYAGYAVATLIALRMVWWVYGTGYSRLSTLLRNASQLRSFLPALWRLKPPHYAGHNPAGSVMILALVVSLIILVISGFLVEGGEEKLGPLAGVTWFSTGALAHIVHEWLAYALVAMIIFHIAGVAFETWVQKVPLVRGMVTGQLPLPANAIGFDSIRPQARAAMTAVVALSMFAAAAGYVLLRLPPLGVKVVAANASYDKECSACHAAFHPSLLPKASWLTIMQGLDEHFGEDASLPDEKVAAISEFLAVNAAETSDTEAAHQFRTVSAENQLRITGTPYWTRKHSGISAAVFASPAVRSKSNCAACHSDAASGRFDDSAIRTVPLSATPEGD
jgi:cytochrome b